MCNKYGNFKVAKSFINSENNHVWCKHKTVMECWEDEKGLKYLGEVNHRSILNTEIILDVDDNPTPENLKHITILLNSYQIKYKVYQTGSKGYHIHIFDNSMWNYTKQEREKVREYLINLCKCDRMKMYGHTLIAIENVPHWKTGKVKKRIMI